MTEIILLRNLLIQALNAGRFCATDWQALADQARAAGCENIACQAERYLAHYREVI